jgi:hypothetical protein
MRGEPLLVASCNMLANLSRSKPSRWWETTRAERDRSVGIDRPKEVLLREWTRQVMSAEGRLVSTLEAEIEPGAWLATRRCDPEPCVRY